MDRVFRVPRYLMNLTHAVNSSFQPLLIRELLILALAGSSKIYPHFMSGDLDIRKEEIECAIEFLEERGWIEVEPEWSAGGIPLLAVTSTPRLAKEAHRLRQEARAKFQKYRG